MWVFWEYLDGRGGRTFSEWRNALPVRDRAALDEKMRAIVLYGPSVSKKLLAGPLKGWKHLYKIRTRGPTLEMRPICCRGPINGDREFTLLMPAFEKNDVWDPSTARSIAESRRLEVIADPFRRRAKYEVPQP